MKNLKKSEAGSGGATWGNGVTNATTMVGELSGMIFDKYGMPQQRCTFKRMEYIPGAMFNLCSLTKLQEDGWIVHGDKNGYVLTKGPMELKFDIGIRTRAGVLWCMYFACDNDSEVANISIKVDKNIKPDMNIKLAHARLGHFGEDLTKKTSKQLGWKLACGSLGTCEPCTIGKAKRKKLPKVTKHPLEKGQIRMYIDQALIKNRKGMPKIKKPYWCMQVLEPYGIKLSQFNTKKDAMVEEICKMLHKWQEEGKGVTHIRLDNAGENNKLQKQCGSKDWKLLNIKWEFTSRNTPQQNSAAEVAFWAIKHRGIAMMTATNVPKEIQFMLFGEAVKTATMLDWLVPVEINGVVKTRYEHWTGEMPAFALFL